MFQFIVNIIDQMDTALDNLVLGDGNYKRFSLMLIDNAIELTLHKFAENENLNSQIWGMPEDSGCSSKLINAALGQHFESKVKLAKSCGLITEDVGNSIRILHSFRNQVYHQGLQHETILSSISLFYFRIVCDVLANYKSHSWTSSSIDKVPYRAKKYIYNASISSSREQTMEIFLRLKEISNEVELLLIHDLSRHMMQVIYHIDEMIDFLASDGPKQQSRDEVVIESQVWFFFTFTDEGKEINQNHKKSIVAFLKQVEMIRTNHTWPYNKDPIPSWTKRYNSLKNESDNHIALKKYQDFMKQTSEIRNIINRASSKLDRDIQHQIDYARGK